jgi:magnesium-protoporphyrin O-methyltransferase
MKSCQCEGIEAVFNQAEAGRKLKEYHKKGPVASTRLLLSALRAAGVAGRTLLDVGGGVGAIQYDLLKAGARTAISVDASPAYVALARQEASRQGLADRIEYHLGDFVEVAHRIPSADIVTLDRVICCYDDMPALVRLSAERAGQLYALVFPQDALWVRLAIHLENLVERIRGSAYRAFVHPTAAVEAILLERGLARRYYRRSGVWQIAVYARSPRA